MTKRELYKLYWIKRNIKRLEEKLLEMETDAFFVEGRHVCQDRVDSQLFSGVEEVIEDGLAYALTGESRFEEIGDLGGLEEGGQGIVGAQESKAGRKTLLVFRDHRRVSAAHYQKRLEEIIGQPLLGIGGKSIFDIIVEDVHHLCAVIVTDRR